MAESDEIQRIEQTLARLDRELSEARRALVALRAAWPNAGVPLPAPSLPQPGAAAPRPVVDAAPATASPPAAPALRPRVTGGNFVEQLVGRYGALALAAITIVMGAGALVSWALRQGLLTPAVRVLLGSLLAAVLAAAGLALRAKGNRSFGHTLLALSLAVVHVVAWGAGPRLGLVPASASLAIAAAASVLLSSLAMRDDAEALFAVGVGGALLAPFVQHSGKENYPMLAAYGVVVSATALRTMAARPWRLVATIAVIAAFAYALALNAYHGDAPWMSRSLPTAFIVVLAVAALALARPPLRARTALGVLAVGLASGDEPHLLGNTALALLREAPDVLVLALAGMALALYAARELPRANRGWWIGGSLALPAVLLVRALGALTPVLSDGPGGRTHAAVAGVWVLGYGAASLWEQGTRRGALMASAGIVATWAAVLGLHAWPNAVPAACASVAILAVLVARREAQPVVLVAAVLAAVVGYGHGLARVIDQPGFGVPFSTAPSLALAACMVGLGLAARLAPDDPVALFEERVSPSGTARVLVALGCFMWWRSELARAISADAATFLLIVYYAASGVVVLWQGRVSGSQNLRRTGLALSVWAAVVAIASAFDVQQIALRVGSYLAVGAFLLGVAWWYRAGQETAAGEGT